MNLDMAVRSSPSEPAALVDFVVSDGDKTIRCWTNHLDMHLWMKEMYHLKNGATNTFVLPSLALNEYDLHHLAIDIQTCSGFDHSRDTRKGDDLAFIDEALDAIADGKHLYYTSRRALDHGSVA